MHYFYYPPELDLGGQSSIELSRLPKTTGKHFKARRLHSGDRFAFLNGRGLRMECRLEGDRIHIESTKKLPPAGRVRVLMPILDTAPMKTLLPALTQLGVRGIVFYESSFSQRRRFHRDKWLEVCRQSITQNGNPWVPAIRPFANPVAWPKLLAWLQKETTSHRIQLNIGDPQGPDTGALLDDKLPTYCLAGPEGGFSPEEQAALRALTDSNQNCRRLKLAGPILRAETAAVVLAAKSFAL